MPVEQICLAAMVLRNAHVTMNGCNTCKYFACPLPLLMNAGLSMGLDIAPYYLMLDS